MKTKILKSRLRCQTTSNGFTLIEVVLALFIGSLVLVTLYGSFFQIIKSKEIAESELELYHESRVIMARLSQDLASLYARGNVYNSESNYVFTIPVLEGYMEGDQSFVRFTSLSRHPGLNEKDSDQALITYYTVMDDETGLFKLYRSENPYFNDDSNVISYPVSENVILFRLNYLNGVLIDDQSFTDSWNTNDQGKLPDLVELVLVLKSPRGEPVEFRTLIKLRHIF